jgi:hypothetical protein
VLVDSLSSRPILRLRGEVGPEVMVGPGSNRTCCGRVRLHTCSGAKVLTCPASGEVIDLRARGDSACWRRIRGVPCSTVAHFSNIRSRGPLLTLQAPRLALPSSMACTSASSLPAPTF